VPQAISEEPHNSEVSSVYLAAVERVDDVLEGLPADDIARIKATAEALLETRAAAEESQREARARATGRQDEILGDRDSTWPTTVAGGDSQHGNVEGTVVADSDFEEPADPPVNAAEAVEVPELDDRTSTEVIEQPNHDARPVTSPDPLTSTERDALVAEGARTFARSLNAAQSRFGIRSDFLLCVMRIESDFEPRAISRAGAVGLMQLMPTTADELGANPWDLSDNITGGAKLIDQLLDRYGGDVGLAMAAYNAGPGAVAEYGGVPPYRETRDYVARVKSECPPPRP
jgi:hypothetical protein